VPAINRRNLVRALIAAALFAVGISIPSLVIAGSENTGNKDFISYWATGQLLIRHLNPYELLVHGRDHSTAIDLTGHLQVCELRPIISFGIIDGLALAAVVFGVQPGLAFTFGPARYGFLVPPTLSAKVARN
jgi:hypothetical protein